MRRLKRLCLASSMVAALFAGTSFAQPPEERGGPPRDRGPGGGERGPGERGPRDGDQRERGPGERGPRDGDPGERGPRDRGPGERGPGGGRERGPEGERGFRGGPPPEMMMRFMPVLAALDADKDGKISSAEIDNATAALRTLDKNNDGSLTVEELRPDPSAFPGRGGPGGPRPGGDRAGGDRPGGDRPGGGSPEATVSRFMQMDKNDDGFLTQDEVGERMQGLIARADKNEDGKASREELIAMAAAMNRDGGNRPGGDRPGAGDRNPEEMVARIFEQRDTNGDGKLTDSEIPEQMAGRLEQIDTDSDGSVSREELGKAMSRMRAGREGARPGGDRGPREEAGGARPKRPEAE